MKKQLNLVKDFHNKFDALVSENPSNIPKERYDNRYRLMKEEVDEYLLSVENKDIVNTAKELADVLYAVYGTILEHGLQDIIEDVFQEVHSSNMSKDYHKLKMIKGQSYFKADVAKFFKS